MSILLRPRQLLQLPYIRECDVDESQIMGTLRTVERITSYNFKTFCDLRCKVPAGTEICGVILRKSSNAHSTHATAPTSPPCTPTQTPPTSTIFGEQNNSVFAVTM